VLTAGNNVFSGAVSVGSGTLQFGTPIANGSLGAASYSIASGAKLYLNYATAAAPSWAAISGNGTLELNSAQAVNGTANWTSAAALLLPTSFGGTFQVDNGRFNCPPSGLGNASNVVVNNGAQYLMYDGAGLGCAYTFPQSFAINGLGWGESGQTNGALRVSGANMTISGSISLTGNSGLYTQNTANSSLRVSGPISGNFGLSVYDGNTAYPIILSGASSYSGTTTIANGTLQLGDGASGHDGSLATSGVIDNAVLAYNLFGTSTVTYPISGAGTVTKNGLGTLVLAGTNVYTGSTTAAAGTLKLDFSNPTAPANNIVNNSANNSGLVLAGGSLIVQGNPTSPNTQQFNGLTVNVGPAEITATGGTTTTTLGAITRTAAGATVDFAFPAASSFSTTTPNASFSGGAQTILGGYATVNGGSTWAVSGNGAAAGTISGLANGSYAGTFTGGADVDASIGASAPAATTYNSLRLNKSGSYAIALSGGTTTIATGGIMETANVGANAATIGGGSLTDGDGVDLIVQQYNPSAPLTIASSIVNGVATAQGLTKSGPGLLVLAGADGYTGPTVVTGGTLQLASGSSLSSATSVTLGNGPSGAAFVLGNGGAAVNPTIAGLTFSNISGTSSVSYASSSPSTLTIGSGGITVNSAGYSSAAGGATTIGTPLVLSAAQSWNDNSNSPLAISLSVSAAGALTVTGSGTGGVGVGGNLLGNQTLNVYQNGTLTLSGGSNSLGQVNIGSTANAVINPVLVLSAGTTSISGRLGFGNSNSHGVMDITNNATVTASGDFIMFGDNGTSNKTGAGAIYQSSGVFNVNTSSGVLMAWAGNSYGAYMLSGGTLNGPAAAWNIDNQNQTYGLFSQSGGVANFKNTLAINQNSSSAGGIVDISGGTLYHTTAGNLMGTTGAGAVGVLTVRNNGYLQEQTGNFYVTAASNAATGIVNVITGGTLEANRIQATASGGASANINFDGGTLRAYSTNAGGNFLAGLTNAFVYPGGLTVDTNSQSVAIGQALTAPSGYGVGLSGGTIAVPAALGGSGYIAPPVVLFAAPASGVPATGVAVLNSSGAVTGIIITSPGSGYTSGQAVAINFNSGNNSATEAVSPAAGFNATASTLNGSGGLTKINNGTLNLSGSNTYAGPTAVLNGTLLDNGSLNASSAVTVSGGATFGGAGSAGGVKVAAAGTIQGGSGGAGSLSVTSLTFSGAANLYGALGSSATSAAAIIDSGALTTNGANTININITNQPSAAGTYHYLSFGSLPSPEGYSAFQFSSPVRAYTLVTTDPGYLDISYNPTIYPIWTGTNSSAFVGGNNWKTSSNGAATDFLSLDSVVFDDSAGSIGGSTSVVVNANVNPSSTTFKNSLYNYTLSGSGSIVNGSLTMNGAGMVTINNTNTFTGAVNLNGGTISVAAIANGGIAQPLGAGGLLVFNGGLLDYSGSNVSTSSVFSIPGGGGLQIDNPGAVLTLTSALAGTGTLTKNGPGGLTLAAGGSAGLTINAGTVNFPVAESGRITLNGGAANLANTTYSSAIAVNGGTLSLAGGSLTGPLSVANNGVVTLNNGSTTMNFGSGTADTTANAYNGTTYITGYHVVLNKAANTPAMGGNIVVVQGNWPYHDFYPVSNNLFAPGAVLTFAATNTTVAEFHLNGFNQTLAGLNCSNGLAIFENAGYDGGNDNNIAPATLTLNGTGTYSYNASLRDENNGSGNGALSVLMQGPGTQVFAGGGIGGTTGGTIANSGYSGTTTINGGVLRFNLTNALPGGQITLNGGVLELQSPATLTSNLGAGSNGYLQVTGGTTGFSAYGAPINVILNNSAGSTVQFGSAAFNPAALVLNAATANNTINFQNQLDLNGGQRTVVVNANPAYPATISGGIFDSTGGSGGLTKAGSGALILANYNSYTGPTIVNAGNLYVNGSLNMASTATVAAGAVLGGQGYAGAVNVLPGGGIEGGQSGTGSLNLTNLTYSGAGNLNVTPQAFPYVPLVVSGNDGLTLNGGTGSVLINIAGPSLSSGTYHLLEYTGEVMGTDVAGFQIGSSFANAHSTYTLVNDQLEGYLNLTVTSNPVVWSGSASNSWDTVVRSPGVTNWYLQSSGSATDFLTNDQVIFDDTAKTGNVVINSGNVTASSVTFNNDLLNYTLSGTSGIAGPGGLTLNGSGAVTITTTNSFTGPVVVNGGTLSVPSIANGGSNSPLGAGTSVTLGNGAMLDYSGVGAATSNRSFTLNSGGAAIRVDNAGATLTLTSPIGSNSPGSTPLVKSGLGGLTLSAASSASFAEAMTISQGTLDFNNAAAVGSAATVTLGDANTGAQGLTLVIDSSVANALSLANIYTSSFGTAQTIVLNAGSGLAANGVELNSVLNLSGTVPLTIRATNTGGHSTRQDWSGQIVGSGIPTGTTALVLDGTAWTLRLTFGNGNGALPANDFTGDVVMLGDVTTQGVTYLGAGNSNYQNLGFLNNNVTVLSGGTAAWHVVWGGETVMGLNGSGNIALNNQNALNNIGLTVGNNDGSGTFSGNISGGFGLDKTGSGIQILTGSASGGVPYAGSSFSGNVVVDGGVLVAAALASGNNTVLGTASNGRSITVNSGATLLFVAPNVTATGFSSTNVPTLNINGGTVTNAEPGAPFPSGLINNALNNVNLTSGVLTATTGQHGGYAAWNINGTITSSGNSLISTSDPLYGTVMLSSSGGAGGVGFTTINVTDTQLTISAPLVEDKADGDVSGLNLVGPGTLLLTASNRYSGGTYINNGVLQIGNSAALGSGALAANGGALDLSGFGVTVPSFSGAAGIVTNNGGKPATLSVNQANATTFSGSLTDGASPLGLSLAGSGMLVLAGNNNAYSGPTTVNGGTLMAGAANAFSPGSAITVSRGALDATVGPQTVASLLVGGSGALNLSLGNVVASSGTAGFAAGSTLNLYGAVSSLPELLMTYSGPASGAFSNIYYDGVAQPSSDLVYSSGMLELVGTVTGPPTWITGNGNWSNGVNWSAGTAPNGPGQSASFSQSGGGAVDVTLDVPVTLGSLALGGTGASYALSGNTLTLDNSGNASSVTVLSGSHSIATPVSIAGGSLVISESGGAQLTVSGNVSDDNGSRSLTLNGDGSGQLVLTGHNTYSGGTTVDAGMLIASSPDALPSGSNLTVGQGASSLFAPANAGPVPAAPAAEISAVPEPGTIALLLIAFIGAAGRAASRRRSR
jgi:fibronectin-binding autotransporter adhesin